MQQGAPRRRRARPVADAPLDELLARSEEIAKGWLLALVEEVPLDRAPAILAADLARDGPRLCDAIARALADDSDLRRLEPGGALELLVSRTGELAGATVTETASHAVDVLHAVIWSAVREELRRPDPDQLVELAERLNQVIELVRAASLRRSGGAGGTGPVAARDGVAPGPPPAVGGGAPGGPVAAGGGASGPGGDAGAAASRGDAGAAASCGDAGAAASRGDAGALWLGALENEISRAQASGASLSLLLAELDEADRMLAVEPVGVAAATFGKFAQAVRSVVRRQDILACESDTRAWIIARDTGRPAAQALRLRVAQAVRDAEAWRGAPMTVSVGVAVLGEDGRDSESLIEVAEEAALAAAAGGIGIIRAVPAPRDHDPGDPRGA
jgi:GGDEF domain-containing protein